MQRKSLVSINYQDYILGFAREVCAFDGQIRCMYQDLGAGKLNLTQMDRGEVRRLEIDNLDAYLAVYDDAEYNVCLAFEDVSFRWQNHIINNCPQSKKLALIRELIDIMLVDLQKTGDNMLKIGKNFTYEVLKDYSREYEKFYPEMLRGEFKTISDRLNELVSFYLNERKANVQTQEDVQKLIDFVDQLYYRAESIVGEARDTYLDQRVERDIIDGKLSYRFMDETIEIDKKKGVKSSYNQKEIYDYCEDMLVVLDSQRAKFVYCLDRLEDSLQQSEDE